MPDFSREIDLIELEVFAAKMNQNNEPGHEFLGNQWTGGPGGDGNELSEHQLATGKLHESSLEIEKGSSEGGVYTIAGQDVFVKEIDEAGARAEVDAYHVAQITGLANVPPTAERGDGVVASQIVETGGHPAENAELTKEEIQAVGVFAVLVGNGDLSSDSLLRDDNGKLWTIDHEASFRDPLHDTTELTHSYVGLASGVDIPEPTYLTASQRTSLELLTPSNLQTLTPANRDFVLSQAERLLKLPTGSP